MGRMSWFPSRHGGYYFGERDGQSAVACVWERTDGTWHWDSGDVGCGDEPTVLAAQAAAERAIRRGVRVETPIEPASSSPPRFELRNDPPRRRPRRFESQERTLQKALIDGLDCLPGQADLF